MFEDLHAVFFDLDGTLVDTIPLILAAHEHTFRRHMRGPFPDERAIVGNMGRSLTDALGEYAAADGAADPARAATEMLATYRAFQREHHRTLTREYAGIHAALETLAGRGYALGVVTSKVEWMARLTLGLYGLERYFATGVFHDDTARHKPEPDPLIEAARRGAVDPRAVVYVGDSVHDVAAGRAAGMKTIAALWGPFDRVDLERAGPDALAARPDDLPRLLPGPAA